MGHLMDITHRIQLLPATSQAARRAKIEVVIDHTLDGIDFDEPYTYPDGVLLSLLRDLAGDAGLAEQRKRVDSALKFVVAASDAQKATAAECTTVHSRSQKNRAGQRR